MNWLYIFSFIVIVICVKGEESNGTLKELSTVKELGVVPIKATTKDGHNLDLSKPVSVTTPSTLSSPATVKNLERLLKAKDVEEVELIHPPLNPDVETFHTVKNKPPISKQPNPDGKSKKINPVSSPKKEEKIVSNPRGIKASKMENIDYTDYDCLDTRYAPTSDKLRQSEFPYVISDVRLEKIRNQFLYCFFDKGGDYGHGDLQVDIHDSSPQIHKNLNFQLPFYGFRFNYTRVSVNGYLQFSDPPVHYRYPLAFPNPLYPKENDPSFIGIFFSKCRIGMIRPDDVDQRTPGVYFRMERDLQTRTDQFGVEMRERLMWDIRQGIIGAETFIPKHSAIITWKNVSFAGGIDSALYKTNTFQLVLATDEVFTYAIFNYVNMDWTTHTEAGGDTTTGEGGTPAFIGFNAGNGTSSYSYQPYSQNSVLRDLVGRGWGNSFPGRHIFRIDEKIMLGTCNKDYDNQNIPLIFAPESGNMLGGTVVNITGPCFEEGIKIQCRFDTETVIGTRKDMNRAICVQPFVFAEGYVNFEVAIGDNNFKWKGKYFVETPATATQRITFSDDDDVHKRNPTHIDFTWVPKNLTDSLIATIRISLWGYRENTIRPELLYIDMIEESTNNDGYYRIIPSNYRNRDNSRVNDVEFGFIMINLTNPESYEGLIISPVIWSRPIPLGWYFNPQWERLYGSNWPETKCNQWLMNDRYLKNFASEVPICPCSLEHALQDKGRFLPDSECDMDTNRKCYYNKGAIHCVRSGHPSKEGSGQQCCYDKNNYLMMSYDQQWGSRPQRSHNLGFLPWNEANKVPSLSNWLHDVIPFYQCCLWQGEQAVGCETYRFERRPTQDCIAYQSPAVAAVFGDPHIVTFDELEYTFNGKGEFVLVRADTAKHKLDIQGRFEQMPINIYGEVRATQLTAIAAQENSSAVIEVRVRPRWAQWRYHLDVLADEKPVFFDREALRIQHFRGVTVYMPRYILNQSQVIIMFESGAGVEVIENRGFLSSRVYLPWSYINQTKGLFGNWSYDMTDDFTKPDSTYSNINLNNLESIHKDFAINWLLDDHEDPLIGKALFSRLTGRTSSFYTNRTFEPVWYNRVDDIIPANRSYDRKIAMDLCSDNIQCQYDYALTLNRDLAYYTKKYYSSLVNIREINQRRVVSCGVLETPHFGRKSNFFFTPGSKVIFECNKDFVLQGDPRRSCTADGEWDTPEFGYTECLRGQEYSSQKLGITFGIILAIVVPIICIIFCLYQHSRRAHRVRDDADDPAPSWRFSPGSNLSTSSSGYLKPKRIYDRVYRTGEPLPGRTYHAFPPPEPDEIYEDPKMMLMSSGRESSSSSRPSEATTHRISKVTDIY